MKNQAKFGLLGLLALGCAQRDQNDLGLIFNNLGRNESILIGYDYSDCVPFNPSNPNETLPVPDLYQLRKELKATSDIARKDSIQRTILLMEKCIDLGAAYDIVRVSREEPLGSGMGRLYGAKPTRVVYTMNREPTDKDIGRVARGYGGLDKSISQYGFNNSGTVQYKAK